MYVVVILVKKVGNNFFKFFLRSSYMNFTLLAEIFDRINSIIRLHKLTPIAVRNDDCGIFNQ